MARHAQAISCSQEEARVIAGLIANPRTPQGMVRRLKVVQRACAGATNEQIAGELGLSVPAVRKWRGRFGRGGLAGLRDLPRPGKPRTYKEDFRLRVLQILEKPPPKGQAVWDGPSLARHLGASDDAVWRVLRREGICLSRQRSWCVSTDPEFAVKAADIIGLYLNPPLNALVISMDEKPSIQALTRPTGYVETSSGKIVRGFKSTYKRNGTLTLFAALEVATGHVIGRTSETKKREDFRAFMDSVLSELPADKHVHVILDNLNTHKKNEDWLAKYEGRVTFHFTPTSASWLNLIEVWFGMLSRKALRGASFPDKANLREAIEAFIAITNENPRPFKWRKREVRGSQLRNTVINLRN
jgi:transposase